MTLGASVNGIRVVVPGVYSRVSVEDNLANVTPGPRNIFICGEAEKGVPGALLNLSGVFFQDYETLKAFYGSGPLVDAARMIFQNQASPVFASSVNAIYTYKTNGSTLAQRTLSQGLLTYALLASAEYGEDGNLINTQIQDSAVEVLPSIAGHWIMKNESSTLNVRVSGGAEQSAGLSAEATPAQVVSALNAMTGLAASGGANLELLDPAQVGVDTLTVTVDGTYDARITVTCSASFGGSGYASVLPGHVLYIPFLSNIAGASEENVGAYTLVSKTANSLTLDKISSSSSLAEIAPVLPVGVVAASIDGVQSAPATSEILSFAPLSAAVDATTAVGTGAALELYFPAGNRNSAQRLYLASSQSNPVSAAVALSASVALSSAAGLGVFSISGGSFQNLPKVGDTVWVLPTSLLAGAGGENIGAWVVSAAGSTSISATKVVGNGASVSSVALAGQEAPFSSQAAISSTSIGPKTHTSSAERQVRLIASRQSDGLTFPAASVGGRIVLEIGYVGTTATLTVTKSGRLQTAVTGGSGANLDIQLGKFATLGDLIAFINSKTGYKAKVSSSQLLSLAPRAVLDQVAAVSICSGHAANATPGRIKADFSDFKKLLDDNFGLVSLTPEAALVSLSGLPDAEALSTFLSGGTIGSTSNVSIAAALDAALKVEVTQVVTLFSRDAAKDIEDGSTDPNSNYTIDSVNALVKSHVATASNADYRKERFGVVSFHGSFDEAKEKAAELAFERVQMTFQQTRAVGSDGNIQWFLPWMLSCAISAGRVQAALGTSLLRKSFQVSDVKHVGDASLFSDILVPDFDPDTKELDQAIEAGLVVLRPVTGFGVRMESPDLSTRSRENDPKGWVFERVNVQFVLDEVIKNSRQTLENYIGSRTSDVSPALLRTALSDVLQLFVSGGALRAFSIDSVRLDGNTYKCTLSVFPTEAVEFITLDVLARRTVGETA